MNKKAFADPINLVIGFVALVGVISFFINQPKVGLVFLVISTLIEAILRMIK